MNQSAVSCWLAALCIISLASLSATTGQVDCLQISDLFEYIKNPLYLHFEIEGEPENRILQRDLDDFFYLNEYNDHKVKITPLSHENPASAASEENDGDGAVKYAMRTLHAKYKACIRGVSTIASSFYDSPSQKELASSPRVNQSLCGKQLDFMIANAADNDQTHISRGSNINLMRIMDTFGRPGISTFESQLSWVGNYQQCINSKLLLPSSSSPAAGSGAQSVPMHYCWGHFRYPEWPNSTFYERNLNVKVALCLPETCDSYSYDYHKKKLIKLTLSNFGARQAGFYMSSLYCLPHKESKLLAVENNPIYTLFWLFTSLWMLVIVACSVYHFFLIIQNQARLKQEKKLELHSKFVSLLSKQPTENVDSSNLSELKLLRESMSAHYHKMRMKQAREIKQLRSTTECERIPTLVEIFSVISNCRKLFSVDLSTSRQASNDTDRLEATDQSGRAESRIPILDGLKGIAITIVVFGHCTLGMIMSTLTTVEVKGNFNFAYSEYFFIAPFVMLNCFLIITGLLTSLLLFKRGKKFVQSPLNWILITIVRYLRVMPVLLFAVWMTKANQRLLGHGPLWDYGTANMSRSNICENESWWLSLFLLNNLRQMNFQCVGPAWYLATDFQLYIMTAPFLILLSRNQRLGYLACGLVCLAGIVTGTVTLMWGPLDKLIYILKPPYNAVLFEEVHYYYTLPINRSGPYFIGLIVGHMLDRINRGTLRLESQSSYVWLSRWPLNTILARKNSQDDTTTTTDATADKKDNNATMEEVGQKRGLKQLLFSTFKTHSILIALISSIATLGSLPNYFLIKVFDCQGSWDSPMVRLFLAATVTIVTYLFCLLLAIAVFFGSIGYDKTYYYSIVKFRLWRPIARASLSILVFHAFIMTCIITNNISSLEPSSLKTLLTNLFGTGLICIVGSMVLCIIFEYPLTNTIDHVLKTYIYNRVISPVAASADKSHHQLAQTTMTEENNKQQQAYETQFVPQMLANNHHGQTDSH